MRAGVSVKKLRYRKVLYADFLKDEDATKPDYFFFNPYDRWIDIRDGSGALYYVLEPEDAQDKRISWTISDPEIALIMDYGDWISIVPQKVGDAVITGTTKSGLQNSIPLHVYDSSILPDGELTALAPSEEVLTLYPGESKQMKMLLTPENNRPQGKTGAAQSN